MILRNNSTAKNHWITLYLSGKRSNRLAIGAKVKLTAGEMVQIEEVRSGGSYLSQNDLRLHFGIGTASKADRVEVRWPSGEVLRLNDVKADHFYRLSEGGDSVTQER